MSKSEDTQSALPDFDDTTEEFSSWTPVEEDEPAETDCQGCGSSPTEQFRRVFGDNDDVVHGCPECSTYRELHDGGAVQ